MKRSIEKSEMRSALIAELVNRAPSPPGRTGIMKMVYFLQVLRGVPLGYNFRIYTYGPYDGQVLEDLKVAEAVRAVEAEIFRFPGGTGVHIKKGSSFDAFIAPVSDSISEFNDDLNWVAIEFGSRSAVDLEIESTVLFVDRSKGYQNCVDIDDIVTSVYSLKPHHSPERIRTGANKMKDLNVLISVR